MGGIRSISSGIKLLELKVCLRQSWNFKEVLTLEPYTSRSAYGGLLLAKFFKFFYEANCNVIFGEVNS